MSKLFIPEGYKPALDLYRTQRAISFIKQNFQESLAKALNLKRVSAPLFVTEASGLNDNLNGTERPVSFDIPDASAVGQVVHSLAKWKRLALKEYGFYVGYGLYTDMNAIRRDEELDNIHSIYVDQWDWEKVITRKERTLDYLKEVASTIVNCICDVCDKLHEEFPDLKIAYSQDIYGIEYAAILKNIYALAGGLAAGLGYGDNFRAVLAAASARELTKFVNESFPFERDTMNSAYLGDLLVTSYSSFSRNRRLGLLIGHGCTVKSALNEMTMIAEGYYAAACIRKINEKYNIEIPIADMVYDVLYRRCSPRKRMKELTDLL